MAEGLDRPRILFFAGIDHTCLRIWVHQFQAEGRPVAVATFRRSDLWDWPNMEVLPYDSRLSQAAQRVSWRVSQAIRFRRIRRILRTWRPDVLHVHWVDVHALEFMRFFDGPVVCTPCGSDVLRYPRENPDYATIAAEVLRRSHVVTYCSQALRDACLELGAKPQACLEAFWGIDTERFRAGLDTTALRNELGLNGQRVIVSTRGSRPMYNLPTIVRAFARALPALPETTLLMLVDKPEAQRQLQALAAELGAAGKVQVRLWVPQEQIPLYYNLADVYVSTPNTEGLGSSNVESVACGAFPIVSDIDTYREWLGDGKKALLVPPGDVEALAAAMVRAIRDEPLRTYVRRENVLLAGDRANVKANTDRLLECYRQLCQTQARKHPG